MHLHFGLCLLLLVICGEIVSHPQKEQRSLSENSSTQSFLQNVSSSSMTKRRVSSGHHHTHHHQLLHRSFDPQGPQVIKWVSAALKYFDFHRCTTFNIASDDECFKLSQLSRSQVALYLGYNRIVGEGGSNTNETNRNGKVFAILPDSNSPKASGAHDMILVLDPYPTASFGHLVALFYLDFDQDSAHCGDQFQTLISDGTCVTVGSKPRCPNLLERFTTGLQPKRCHIDFLPTVYSLERVNLPPATITQGKSDLSMYPDLLECLPLQGFASCPKLRPLEDTTKILCDSTASNSKRCDTSHATVGSSCKLFQTCDRAVLIGGGWNRQHSPAQSLENIVTMEGSLRSSGFSPDNIKTFFANGKVSPSSKLGGSLGRRSARLKSGDYFSSAMKNALRNHIRTLCQLRHCADTLLIYLNNPTTFEGDMLLWDVDNNGIADELEIYSVKEFLADLSSCEAKRVVVIADQTNSDILMASLKTSSDHQNVLLFTAGLPNQTPVNGEFTKQWANSSNAFSCMSHVQEVTATKVKGSNLVLFDPTQALASKLSIIGAPCDLNPPVNTRELKTLYQGCQNVPTSIWFSFDFEEIGDVEGDAGEEEVHANKEVVDNTSANEGDLYVDDDTGEDQSSNDHKRPSKSVKRRRSRPRPPAS